MTFDQLAAELNKAYFSAEDGDKVTQIHLFAINNADAISSCDRSCRALAIEAGIQKSYATELGKGIRLARYVRAK